MPTEKVSYYTGWEKELHMSGASKKPQYIGTSLLVNHDIWLCARGSGHLVRFSTEDESSDVFRIPEADTGISSIAYDGVHLWIYSKKGDLLQWDQKRGVTLGVPKILMQHTGLGKIIYHERKIWAFANGADAYATYDVVTGHYEYREHYLPEKYRSGVGFAEITSDGRYFHLTPNFGEVAVRFDPQTETAEAWKVVIKEESAQRYAQEMFTDWQGPLDEGWLYDAREVALFLQTTVQPHEDELHVKSIGEHIFSSVMHSDMQL